MRLFLIPAAVALTLGVSAALADTAPPSFDAKAICERMGERFEAPASFSEECVSREEAAIAELGTLWETTPNQNRVYCEALNANLSQVLGPNATSAQTMISCAKAENEAYEKLSAQWTQSAGDKAPLCQALLDEKNLESYNITALCLNQ